MSDYKIVVILLKKYYKLHSKLTVLFVLQDHVAVALV